MILSRVEVPAMGSKQVRRLAQAGAALLEERGTRIRFLVLSLVFHYESSIVVAFVLILTKRQLVLVACLDVTFATIDVLVYFELKLYRVVQQFRFAQFNSQIVAFLILT
eukprot:5957020-Amphidinium_carterae.1